VEAVRRAVAVLLLVVAPLAAADDADIEKGLQNLTNIFRIAHYLELKRDLALPPAMPEVTDPWGTAYFIDPENGRIAGAGSDKEFDKFRKEIEQFTGTAGDVVYENRNFARTNHNWLASQVTPATTAALANLRNAEKMLLIARTERGRTMMARYTTANIMKTEGVTAEMKDAWGTPLRVIEENGKRRIISAGADRTFQPESWDRAPAADAGEDMIFEGGKFVRDVDELEMMKKLDGSADPLVQPLEGALRDDPANTKYVRVGNGVKAPVVSSRVEPAYPEPYRMMRITGIVILEVAISETGAVDRIAVLKSLGPAMDASALEAVKKWKFTPGSRDGQPVPTLFNLTINFKLN
jgi:TonB family protein